MSEAERFAKLKAQHKELETKKTRLEEQLKIKEADLKNLVQEIKDAGYEPANLKKVIEEKEAALSQALDTFENDLKTVSAKLAAIEEA